MGNEIKELSTLALQTVSNYVHSIENLRESSVDDICRVLYSIDAVITNWVKTKDHADMLINICEIPKIETYTQIQGGDGLYHTVVTD